MLIGGLASSSSRQTSQEARNARQRPHHPHPPSWRQLLPWVCASSFPSFIYRFTYISYGLSSSYVEGWTIHESWTVKKAECQRIDAFELQYWRRLLRVPWTARRSNQSILKGINPEYSLEELMLKLKLQCFDHLMWRAELLEETLMLEKSEGRRRRGDRGWDGWMASPTQWTWVRASSGRQWRTGKPGVLQFMGSQRVRHDWVTEQHWSISI